MSQTLVLIALCAISTVLVIARPQKQHVPVGVVSLEDAVNRTVLCPIIKRRNSVDGRIPQHIDMILCDEEAIDECPASSTENNCCKRIDKKRRECYQIEITIPVMYGDRPDTIKAQVGCACIEIDGIRATERTELS